MRHQRAVIWVHMVAMHFFLLWKGLIYGQLPGYSIVIKDNNVTVQEGHCVTIPRTFTAAKRNKFKNSSSMWKDISKNKVAFSNKSMKGTKPNFQVIGNPDNGDCTLTITDARREDAGLYHFRFEESETSQNKYSYKWNLLDVKVTDLKDKPEIIIHGELIAGKEVNLICVPPGNCTGTPPNFQWMKSDQKEIWKNSSNITFTPLKKKKQTSVTCTVTFQPGNNITSDPKKLEVKAPYPPSITITTADNKTVNGSVNVNGKEPVTLICRADSCPEADVTWYKGDNIVIKSKSEATLHIDITSDTAYVCSAWNKQGMDLKLVRTFLPVSDTTSQSFLTVSTATSQSFLTNSNQTTQSFPTDSNTSSQSFLTASNTSSQSFLTGSPIWDMLIGAACGIIVSLIIVLLFKFYLGNKSTSTSDLHEPQRFPSSQDAPLTLNNEIYEQVNEAKFQVSEADENAHKSSDLNDVKYTSIKFSKVGVKITPKEPECEYSEIKFS